MEIDRYAVKAHAKELIRTSNPRVLYASVIFIALSTVISLLSNRIVGISRDDLMLYLQYMNNGDFESALSLLGSIAPSSGAQLVNILLRCVLLLVSLGLTIFLLNTLRGTAPDLGNLLDGFGLWWKALLLALVIGVFVFLRSRLLIIPGIIAAYRYSMSFYVLINHPDYGIMECINESKRLTTGWKGTLFVLDLTFLGWVLLCSIPILGWILSVWVTPYRSLTFLQYYEKISGYHVPAEEPADSWAE